MKAASDLGEQMNKAKVVFGEASGAVIRFSETSAESFGISQAAALEAAGGFGAMAQSAGLSEKASADMSVTMVKLAADMASFNNQDPSEMLERLRGGLAGEAEPLRRFGVFISEARVEAVAFAEGIAEAGEELTDAQKVQARYNIIMQDTTKAQGDFARTIGESLPNQIRVLKAQFTDLLAQIGQSLLPAVLEFAKALVGVVEAAKPLLDVIGKLGPAVKLLGEAFSFLISPLSKFVTVVGQGIQPTSEMTEIIGSAAIEMESMQQKAALAESGMRNMTDGAGDATKGMDELADATHKSAEAIRDHRQATLSLTNGFFAILDAADQVRASQNKLNLMQENGREGTQAYELAVRDAIATQGGLEAAVLSYVDELQEQGTSTEKVIGKIQAMAREMGISKGAISDLIETVKDYIREINKIPTAHTTNVTTVFRQQGDFPNRAGPAPQLQHGGLVAATGLAVVHKGEMFSGVNNEMGMGGGVTVIINGDVTGDEIVRKVRDGLLKLQARNATTGL